MAHVNALPRKSAPLISNGALGMCMLVATELMFFSGFLSALVVARAGQGAWPPVGQPRLPVEVTAANTLVLLASAGTLWAAIGRGGHASRAWLALTLALGLVFLGVQGREWAGLLAFGLSGTTSLYGAFFYLIVGAHALHVAAGAGVLAWLLARRREGGELRVASIYWFFVVFLWPVLYALVYLA